MNGAETLQRLIVTYNSASVLEDMGHRGPPGMTMIVDNASKDGTVAVAEARGHAVMALDRNIGFGAAIMVGLRALDTPFVLILNPDAVEAEGCARALLDAAEAYPDADCLVPRLVDETGQEFFRHESTFERRVRDRRPPTGDACIAMVSGAAMLVRRQPFLAFGGFDPDIFLYFEDDDLALRYRAARRAIIYVHGATVCHQGDRSVSGDDRAHRIKDRNFGWSMLYLGRKHFGESGWGRTFVLLARLPVYVLSGRWERVRRTTGRIRGAIDFLIGRPAPFSPARGRPSKHPSRAG